ncbi:cox-type terminal oxidase subunit II [Natrialba magadii ATCC 43099]|uniref:Cox-type terminal oxidase subunit II n=1 Tax=Natrialba magadii (strain ATCC 43099 / DSM 3394 / CCM 3739 / CIP 104546 / IAM 13178 / JCM 8861 / NBRC 102185 / NCIMB 2190 / MS3) TaxID=547559 RepID=D3SX36_NATMM|nr:cytochrome c oxidase subunit II [Natrialba magadii]ADD03856.1 cox-type terminal oxidase subunit II [Natrialba magadii ATCC 43099]ELY33515.1 cytochrome C oxidase subunit II [Natrialba magadii ATCC 43099]
MQVQTRVEIFEEIFLVFLGLGTLVGVVVIAYTLYNAYKYRDNGDSKADEDLPTLGELPTGGQGGKKLFLSFGLSAIIVISLVVWSYGMLLVVEDGPDTPDEEALEVEVEGWSFGWDFAYENGIETGGELVVPADTPIWTEVTSRDVWHTFGISELRVKADAIPGETDETWFVAEEDGEYLIECFELCGFGHSGMTADVDVRSEEEFEQWVDEQLTMDITLEDEAEERVTDGFELELVHEENDQFEEDLSFTYADDEFENGSITIGEIEQGGPYELTITSTDDEFETVEETVDFTGPTDETYTLELGAEDDETDDEEEDEAETNDEADEGEDEETDDDNEGGDE